MGRNVCRGWNSAPFFPAIFLLVWLFLISLLSVLPRWTNPSSHSLHVHLVPVLPHWYPHPPIPPSFFSFFPSHFNFSPTKASFVNPSWFSMTFEDLTTTLAYMFLTFLLGPPVHMDLCMYLSVVVSPLSLSHLSHSQSQNFLKPTSAFTSLFAVCHHCLTWSLGLNNHISFPSFQIQSLLNQLVFTTKDTSCHLFLHFLLQDHFPHLNCDYSSTYTLFGHQQRSLFAFVLNVLQ